MPGAGVLQLRNADEREKLFAPPALVPSKEPEAEGKVADRSEDYRAGQDTDHDRYEWQAPPPHIGDIPTDCFEH